MGKTRVIYNDDFKRKVAEEAMDSKKTAVQIASENGIAPSLVSEWKKLYKTGGLGKAYKQQEKQIAKLEKEKAILLETVGTQALEIELLKKKAAVMAARKKNSTK